MSDEAQERDFEQESPKEKLMRLKAELAKLEKIEADKIEAIIERSAKESAEFQRQLREESAIRDASQTLPFRAALEQEEGLASRVRNSISWLRVIMLIYGGVSDLHIAEYYERYRKLAWALGIDDDTKRRIQVEKLRQEPWWKEKWNSSDDLIYDLAVYLDTEGGALAAPAKDIAPVFEPALIYNDSPLTPLFLEALRARISVYSLNATLWERWGDDADPLARAHILLTLLLTDSQRAMQELRAEIEAAPSSEMMQAFTSHAQARLHSLHGVLLLLANQETIGETVRALYTKLSPGEFCDLVGEFYEVYASVNFTTIKPDKFLLELQHALPYISAEIWTSWLGYMGDDQRYSAAVVFDTIGKKTPFTFALSQLHQARNARFKQVTSWAIEPIPPLLSDPADLFGYGLDLIQMSESATEPVFQSGLTVFIGAKNKEIPGLFEEACAMALTLSPANRDDALRTICDTEEYSDLGQTALRQKIIENAYHIADPAIRARALWRLSQSGIVFRGRDLWRDIIMAADDIMAPLQRELTLERVILDGPLRYREQAYEDAVRAAHAITSAENCARALARLARYSADNERLALLIDAVESVGQIADERARVETALLVRTQLTPNDALWRQLDGYLRPIEDEWLTLKAQNLLSLKLLELHPELSRAALMTPVVLGALLNEINQLSVSERQAVDYWAQFGRPETRAEARRQLIKQASEHEVGALPLTTEAIKVIDALLERGEIVEVYPLLPYLRARLSQAPDVRRWVETKPDIELWRHACLMLAELQQLDTQSLPGLIELLEDGIDLARDRASLALHGAEVFVGKHHRDYRSSQIGYDVQYQMAQAARRFRDTPRLSSVFAWAKYNIAQDDETVFRRMVAAVERETDVKSAAYAMLSTIDMLDPSLYDQFFQAFLDGSDLTKRALLTSWLLLLQNGNNFGDRNFRPSAYYKEQVEEALKRMSPGAFDAIRVIPDRAHTIADLIGELVNADTPTDPSAALFARSWVYPERAFDDLKDHNLYHIHRDPTNAREAAAQIVTNPRSVELLFTWLANALRESMEDRYYWYPERGTLLEVAAVVASLSPAAVFTLIRDLQMEDLLMKAAVSTPWFFGRAGATTLLGYMMRTPANFIDVVIECMQDVAQTQVAALRMVTNLRYFEPEHAPRLIALLSSENTSVAYAAVQMLTVIGRNNKCPQAVRRDILSALSDVIRSADADRGVFTFEEDYSYVYIRNVTTLQNACFKAIMDITSL